VPLTRREREVAILAADGLAAREIGERLYVSRRTVESHLARVYTKLGIGSRAELASLLQDTPR
ncbi:MAG TPA: helix-turn-helix transcriptional regulator, partial [Microthrixaceae bacterium]|nr:helix-turn-helix transcriptional regulator [Microthrixaceae bacterium]